MSSKSSTPTAEARVFVSVSLADAEMLQDFAMCPPGLQQAFRKLIASAHGTRSAGGGRRGAPATLILPGEALDLPTSRLT